MSRMEKINSQLKKEISTILQVEMSDPRLKFVTITQVDTSRDLRHSKVFFSVLGDAKALENAQNALKSARGMIRKLIGQRVKMRFTPEFVFFYDQTLEISARIDETLKEIHHKYEENNPNN